MHHLLRSTILFASGFLLGYLMQSLQKQIAQVASVAHIYSFFDILVWISAAVPWLMLTPTAKSLAWDALVALLKVASALVGFDLLALLYVLSLPLESGKRATDRTKLSVPSPSHSSREDSDPVASRKESSFPGSESERSTRALSGSDQVSPSVAAGISGTTHKVMKRMRGMMAQLEEVFSAADFVVVNSRVSPYPLKIGRRDSSPHGPLRGIAQWRLEVKLPGFSPRDLYGLMLQYPESTWNPKVCSHFEKLVQEVPELCLLRSTYKGFPPFVDPREMVQWRLVDSADTSDTVRVAFSSEEVPDDMQELNMQDTAAYKGYTRAFNLVGGWQFHVWKDEESHAEKGTVFSMTTCADPAGYIPMWVVNKFGWVAAKDFVDSLADYGKKAGLCRPNKDAKP